MDYYSKYLKYKNKYLELQKKISGGDNKSNIILSTPKLNIDDLIHIWLKTWPDQSVPDINVLYNLILFIYNDIKKRKGNTTIHCAGGIGRTGSVYMILKLINEFENNEFENNKLSKIKLTKENLISRIIELLDETRKHRPQAVEQVIQIEYVYRIVRKYMDNKFEYEQELSQDIKNQLDPQYCGIPEYQTEHIDHPHKKILCDNTEYTKLSKNYSCGYDIKIKLKNLTDKEKICLDPVDASGNVIKCKNRYNENPASKSYRINLCNTTINNNDLPILSIKRECYINADLMMPLVFEGKKVYIIATQAPIQTSINDFKTMIQKYKVKRIVMLTKIYEENEGGKEVTIDGQDKKIKEKADDYININATVDNGYKDTYFNIDNNPHNPEFVTVLLNDDNFKIANLKKPDWYKSKNNKKC
jgi:protein tyrosine phosphatase